MVSESPDDTSFLVTWEDGPTGLLSNVIVGVPICDTGVVRWQSGIILQYMYFILSHSYDSLWESLELAIIDRSQLSNNSVVVLKYIQDITL